MGLSRNHSSVSWSLEPFFRVAKAPSNHPKRFVVLAMVLQFHIQSKPQISSALFMAAWMKIEETTWNAKKNSKKNVFLNAFRVGASKNSKVQEAHGFCHPAVCNVLSMPQWSLPHK